MRRLGQARAIVVVAFTATLLALATTVSAEGSSNNLYKKDVGKYSFEEDDAVDKGGEASKACRYDDAEWSDCDPFELIRFRVLHLLHGGRQCEEVKNITRQCTPGEFPPGTQWLIEEHRRCIGELKRLRAMIAELAKYIDTLHDKGRNLLNAYMTLKKHLDELRNKIDLLKRQNDQKRSNLASLRAQIEKWKGRARDLQSELDELRTKYHDLQVEHKEMGEKLKEGRSERLRCNSENDRLKKKSHDLEAENAELKRRLLDADKYKDQLRESKYTVGKLEYKAEKLGDRLERVRDDAAQCKLDLMSAKSFEDEAETKDTHVDLAMDMWIVHNKSKVVYATTTKFAYPTTPHPILQPHSKCLITYYGRTNETCWYETNGEGGEAAAANALGKHHLVEAHWKYFTISVRDAYQCDRAARRHYEFLLKRCKPRHHLPVVSVFRPAESDKRAKGELGKELSTHIYPKPNLPQPGEHNRCWVTFLGAHGQCEAHADKYALYNSDDTPEGYTKGAGTSKSLCFSRRDNWRSYCKTPVLVTYLPEGVSTDWEDADIRHDTHGSRMFEEDDGDDSAPRKINPESINPHQVIRPEESKKEKEHKEYEDTPEFRKSLHMKGSEREAILAQLRQRLGLSQPKHPTKDAAGKDLPVPGPANNPKVPWHAPGVHMVSAPPTKPPTTKAPPPPPPPKAPPGGHVLPLPPPPPPQPQQGQNMKNVERHAPPKAMPSPFYHPGMVPIFG